METGSYATLTRQAGLMREMQIVANNIANAATTGFRQEGLIFAEHVKRVEGGASVSMATGSIRNTSMMQGALVQTAGTFDLAVEGEGFFLIETPAGQRLTRAGSFSPSAEGQLVTPDGYAVLDAGGAPVFLPANTAEVSIGADGTISSRGQPVGQIGLVRATDPLTLEREDGVMFSAGEIEPAGEARMLQGFLEKSNVDPIGQVARMIEVQRAYEMGQSFLDAENERVLGAIKTFIR